MATSDDLIKSVGANIQEKASLIWSVADTLRGPYKPHEYGLVILPMTVIKRFHDCLLPTHQKVLDTAQRVKTLDVKDGFLRNASGYPFYNTSKFTFETLKADPDNIEDNFKDYLNGFSDNVQDILARMKFSDQVERLCDPDAPLLYQVICDFCKPQADMALNKIRAVDMGYIFENLIQRFSESYDEDAGAHFTSRDIVYLMTDLLIQADLHVFDGDRVVIDTLWKRIADNPEVKDTIQRDGRRVFESSVLPKVFDEEARRAYMENTNSFTSLFEDGAKYRAMMNAIGQLLVEKFG